MIVKIGTFFLYLTFEKDDFKGNPNKIEQMKAAIPEEERDYNPDKKLWVIENCHHSFRVIEELGGTAEEPSEETNKGD